MTRLQKLGNLYVRESDFELVLDEIVDAAVAITGADFGNIQLIDHKSGDLRIVGQHGLRSWWLEFRNSVEPGQGTCGTALERGERVIVEDVEHDPIFAGTPGLDVQRKAGVRAVQSTPLMSRSGKPLGMFSTHYRTPRRPDEGALRLLDLLARQAADIIDHHQDTQALREVDRRKGGFLAMLGHELRNPLAPISNGLQLLRSGLDSAKAAQVHDMMGRQIDHLVRLVDDLLEVSRISQWRIELRKEDVDLARVVDDAVAACRPVLVELGRSRPLAACRGPDATRPGAGEPAQHAGKFTKPGGNIQISA